MEFQSRSSSSALEMFNFPKCAIDRFDAYAIGILEPLAYDNVKVFPNTKVHTILSLFKLKLHLYPIV